MWSVNLEVCVFCTLALPMSLMTYTVLLYKLSLSRTVPLPINPSVGVT